MAEKTEVNPVAALLGTGAPEASQHAPGRARAEAAPGFSPLLARALQQSTNKAGGPGSADAGREAGSAPNRTHMSSESPSHSESLATALSSANNQSDRSETTGRHASGVTTVPFARSEGSANPNRVGGETAAPGSVQIEIESDTDTTESDATVLASAWTKAAPTLMAQPSTGAVVRSVATLLPEFRSRLGRVIERLQDEGYDVRVTETFRTQSRQDALFAQGRTAAGPTVTWTRNSNHTQGRAADLMIAGPDEGGYARLAAIAAEEGLHTLGPADPGHIELSGGTNGSLATMRNAAAAAGQAGRPATIAGIAQPARAAGPAMAAAPAAVARVATQPGTEQVVATTVGRRPPAVMPPILADKASQANGQVNDNGRGVQAQVFGQGSPASRSDTAVSQSHAQRVVESNIRAQSSKAGEPIAGAPAGTTPADVLRATVLSGPTAGAPEQRIATRATRQSALSRALTGVDLPEGTAGVYGTETSPENIVSPATSVGARAAAIVRQMNAAASAQSESDSSETTDAADILTALTRGTSDPARAAGSSGAGIAHGSSSVPLANAIDALSVAGGPDIAARVARLLAIQDAVQAAPATGVTLEVGAEDGVAAKIRLGLRGGAIDALIDIADPATAARLGGRVNELRRALERTGLEPAAVVIREGIAAAQTGSRGGTGNGSHSTTDPETGQQNGWSRRDSDSTENRNSRRNAKENRR